MSDNLTLRMRRLICQNTYGALLPVAVLLHDEDFNWYEDYITREDPRFDKYVPGFTVLTFRGVPCRKDGMAKKGEPLAVVVYRGSL